jgi:hypothetical protein
MFTAFVALSATTAAFALQISGSIGFTGSYTASNPADLTALNTLTFGTTTVNGVHDGAFSGIAGGTVATTPVSLTVNQAANAVSINPGGAAIWSVGGFSLVLSSIFENPGNTYDSIVIKGVGTISGNAYEATNGTWIGTFNSAGTNFTFSASATAIPSNPGPGVPDGGSTSILVGISLLTLGYLRRRSIA